MVLTIALDTRACSGRRYTIQDLPQEIQARIYTFTLVEPPTWDKRHNYTCESTPFKAHIMEAPPFALTSVDIYADGKQIKSTPLCSCAKRKGLSLLLASRFINSIASPIFWSKNTFCFMDPVEFSAAVDHNLRPQCRDMIRSLSIIDSDLQGMPRYFKRSSITSHIKDNFWNTLKKCHSLRKLELSPHLIQPSSKVPTHDYLNELIEEVPTFSTLSLAFSCLSFGIPHLFGTMSAPTRFYTAFKVKFLGADIENLADYQRTWRIKAGLDEQSNVRRLMLPTGETAVVKVYGLPPSPQLRNARARCVKAENLKKDRRPDGQRVPEHAAMKMAQQRRRQGREGSMAMEREEYQALQLARGVRRIDLKVMEDKTIKTLARLEKEIAKRSMKAAEESRRLERKRVNNMPNA